MNKVRILLKKPLKYGEEFQVKVPSVNEVVQEPNFSQYAKALTLSQEEVQYELRNKQIDNIPTPLEFLLVNCYYSDQFAQIVKRAFQFFLTQQIAFNYEQKTIILENNTIINEDNFFDLQNLIRQACGIPEIKKLPPIDPNEDPRIRRIKMKALERDIIKARSGKNGGISFYTSLVSICYMNIGITPLNIGEMSYACISDLIRVYQEKEKYELDVKALLAGADSKKIKPKYWIRNSD